MSLEDVMHMATSSEPASRVTKQVARVVLQHPERSSYASSRELAEIAGVDVSSVTRAAQAMGFAGWPELREALRARYLRSLSEREAAPEAADEPPSGAAARSLDADRRAMTLLRPDVPTLVRVARGLAEAKNRVVLGAGPYRALAELAAGHATLLGYAAASPGEGAGFAAAIAPLGAGDAVLAFDFRRLSEGVLRATARAVEHGAAAYVVTDVAGSALTTLAAEVVQVPAEGGERLPTLVGGLAVVNAISAELGALDPARSAAAVAATESAEAALGTLRGPD